VSGIIKEASVYYMGRIHHAIHLHFATVALKKLMKFYSAKNET
jgi:hypothetical protein